MTPVHLSPIAIIPARGGSKRLPRKNIIQFAGKPMIAHPITTAMQSGLFSRIIVSTEDAEISVVSEKYGAHIISRPLALASDMAKVVDVCLHVLEELEKSQVLPDWFCCIYATAALINSNDLNASYRLLTEKNEANGVMGVSAYPVHPYKALVEDNGYLKPLFPDKIGLKSQQTPHVVASNGTFYWVRTDSFRKEQTFNASRLIGYQVPPERAVDLDTPEDLTWAEKMLNKK